KPRWLAVAFDLSGPTFRHDRYEGYKAHREPPPDDLNVQVPVAKDVCRALRIPLLELPGYEADDLIATYARLGREAGFAVVIVASDKDLLQLVGDGVTVLHPVRNVRLDAAGVAESFGVSPDRVRDVLGLMGDSVDNIPGVPGVGEKTALAMVHTYGDLDAVVARAERFGAAWDARDALVEALAAAEGDPVLSDVHAEAACAAAERLAETLRTLCLEEADPEACARLTEVGKVLDASGVLDLRGRVGSPCKQAFAGLKALRKALAGMDKGSGKRVWASVREHAAAARLSRELATLDDKVPVEVPPEALEMAAPDRPRVHELFTSLEFKQLAVEYAGGALEEEESAPALRVAIAEVEVRTLETAAELEALAQEARAAGELALTVSWRGPDPRRGSLAGLGVATRPGRAAWIPSAELARLLAPVLEDSAVKKIGHRTKDAMHVLSREGLPVPAWSLDLELAGFLLDPDDGRYAPDALAERWLGAPARPSGPDRGPRQLSFEPELEVVPQAGREAEALLRLAPALTRLLEREDLLTLYREVEAPLLPLLARMEARGIRVEPQVLAGMSGVMEGALEGARAEIHALAGSPFNVDSPKQLRDVLFDRLGLAPKRTTAKSGVDSTDAATLTLLAEEHPIAGKILEYRELAKLKGTYVDALPALIDPVDGRVHTSYHPTGAATGRLSSSDPNLQNIPVRTEAGRRIRAAFVPEPGYVFLASDYSQVELRVLAHLCQDPELIAAFRAGEDVHRVTAARVSGVALDAVTADMRQRAKVVNFGVLYGMSETRLAREQGLSRAQARAFIHAYFDRFAAVRKHIEETRARARRDGVVRTAFGRLRRFPQLQGRPGRAAAEAMLRAAVNMTVQGTAADLMKMAMLRAQAAVEAAGLEVRMLLQVHDELLFEIPADQAGEAAPVIREAMEHVHPLSVPLAVDQKTGGSWLEVT
ncbi:MAG TPA: DNA polymerase I, partial [Candidatus Polarisedimenticolaceae bacterium]|nr:DNA polymerase I [Candidatus Polarisedimenticolaceae bacterium]